MTLPTSGLITINDRGARAATTFGSVEAGGGNMVFIKKLTASSSGTLSFVDGASSVVLDSTYKEYVFIFKDIHPSNASTRFQFNGSSDTGSNYNVTKTTSIFIAGHQESDSDATLTYQSGDDLAQSTAFQDLAAYGDSESENDSSLAGTLHLFNPSSTTFVKHFIARTNYMAAGGDNADYSVDSHTAGYFNTTSVIDAIQFKFTSNNIDAGTISLYGIL
tara:strand:+ start:1162 stop:1818 length:657 start_codon:yes stop_codon:yes gene_type:complete